MQTMQTFVFFTPVKIQLQFFLLNFVKTSQFNKSFLD